MRPAFRWVYLARHALSLLFLAVIVPFIGWLVPLVLMIWFAFADWPVRKGIAASGGPVKA